MDDRRRKSKPGPRKAPRAVRIAAKRHSRIVATFLSVALATHGIRRAAPWVLEVAALLTAEGIAAAYIHGPRS